MLQVVSCRIRLFKITNRDDDSPSVWAPEPGPLKIVAVDTGAGWVYLEPDDGGVVVAVVVADVTMKNNKGLHVYQSTKQIQVAGSHFENISVSFRVTTLPIGYRHTISLLLWYRRLAKT